MSGRFRHPRQAVLLIALLGSLLLTSGVVLGATLTRSGKAVTALKVITHDVPVTTSSMTYVDVPVMSISVNVPSRTQALFMIQFTANSHCKEGGHGATVCPVRAVVDGTPVQPSHQTFDESSDHLAYETRSAHWVAGPLSAGAHVVKLQYAAGIASAFTLDNMTLTVLRSTV